MIVSSSVNRVALVVAVLLAAGIGWIAITDREPLLIVLGLGLLVVGPFVRRPESPGATAGLRGRMDQLQPMAAPPANSVGQEATSILGMSPQVRDLIVAGQKIGAIKRYREESGLGLKEAKDAVDEFARQLALPR